MNKTQLLTQHQRAEEPTELQIAAAKEQLDTFMYERGII